jgi:hypothetical protein
MGVNRSPGTGNAIKHSAILVDLRKWENLAAVAGLELVPGHSQSTLLQTVRKLSLATGTPLLTTPHILRADVIAPEDQYVGLFGSHHYSFREVDLR